MFKVRVMSDDVFVCFFKSFFIPLFFPLKNLGLFFPSQHMNRTVIYAWMNGMKKKKHLKLRKKYVLTCRIHYVQKEYITMVVSHSTFWLQIFFNKIWLQMKHCLMPFCCFCAYLCRLQHGAPDVDEGLPE